MPTLKIYIGADDSDVQEIIDGLDDGERSAWVRDAIRHYAGVRTSRQPVQTTDHADVVAALDRIAAVLQGVAPLMPQLATLPVDEDAAAAERLEGMF